MSTKLYNHRQEGFKMLLNKNYKHHNHKNYEQTFTDSYNNKMQQHSLRQCNKC